MSRRKKSEYPYPIVEVLWRDAESSHGWEDETESDHTIPEVWTVGFLVHESEAGITVASTAGKDRSTNARLKIPKAMIVTMRKL